MSETGMTFKLFGRDVSASKALKGVGNEAQHTGKALSSHIGAGTIAAGAALGNLAAGGIATLIGSFGSLVTGARDAAAAQRITAQVIKTTGGAANVTVGQIGDLATAISNKTGIDDDAIVSAENLLLTFTNVHNEVGKGNDIFNQATQAAADMSTALGTDSKTAAMQLGKALNDPIKGMTALGKAGVSFTAAQKEQIKTLVKSGDALGAQKIILAEVGKEFGGAAEAASDPMKKLGTLLENTGKELAANLLPAFDAIATWIMETGMPAFKVFMTWAKDNILPILQKIGRWVMDSLVPAFRVLGAWIMDSLVPAFQKVGKFIVETLWPALQKLWAIVWENLKPAIAAIADLWTTTLLPAIQAAMPVLAKIGLAIGVVIGVIIVIVSWIIGKLVPAIATWIKILVSVVGFIIGIGVAAYNMVSAVIGYGVTLVNWFTALPGRISSAVAGMWDGMKSAFKGAINWIIDAWNNFHIQFPSFTGDWNGPLPGGDFTIGGWTLDTPNLPRLAKGGITTRAQLAMVGEAGPEAIIPLSRMGSMGTTVVVNVNGLVVGTQAQLAQQIGTILQRGNRQGIRYGLV